MKSKLTKRQQREIKLNSQAIHIVHDAIKLIEKGWTKKRYAGISVPKKRKVYNTDISNRRANVFCILGALKRAKFNSHCDEDAYKYAFNACNSICAEKLKKQKVPITSIDPAAQFNDRKITKKSDVITALQETTVLLTFNLGHEYLLPR